MSSFPSIDWQAPWWQPWRELGQRVMTDVQAGTSVHTALNAQSRGAAISFVAQSALPEGHAYEAFIFETKTVPTRDNLHDFFNGLAWLRFPLTKARLNTMQYAEIQKTGVQPLRGALRDALTLFDENAAFLCSEQHSGVIAALRRHDWDTAFHTERSALSKHPPLLFGHALLEKLVSPYKSITAHVFPVRYAIDFASNNCFAHDLPALDAAVAAQLCNEALLPKPFAPLQVLGVPNWLAENEKPDFYTDRTVFRPPRP